MSKVLLDQVGKAIRQVFAKEDDVRLNESAVFLRQCSPPSLAFVDRLLELIDRYLVDWKP